MSLDHRLICRPLQRRAAPVTIEIRIRPRLLQERLHVIGPAPIAPPFAQEYML